MAFSKENNYPIGEAWSLLNRGAANAWIGNYDTALDQTFKAIDKFLTSKDREGEMQCYYNLAVVFYFLADFEQQVEYSKRSLKIAEEIDDKVGVGNALNGIASAHYTFGKPEDAIPYLERALKVATEIGAESTMGRVYDGLGQSYYLLKNYTKAIEYKNKVLDIYKNDPENQIVAYAHEGLGEINRELKAFDKAHDHFKTSVEIRTRLGFKLGIGQSSIKIADLYLSQDNLEEALRYYKSGLFIGEDIGSDELMLDAHLGLSTVYEALENLPLFSRHLKAHYQIAGEAQSRAEEKKLKAVELKGRYDQVQLEKEELERKNMELQQSFEDVRTLSSIGNEITATHDLEGIFDIIYARINSLMKADGMFIGICNRERNALEVRLALDNGVRDDYFEYSLDEYDKKLPAFVAKYGTDVYIKDYQNEIHDYLEKGEEIIHEAPSSLVIIPLQAQERTIGVLLAQSHEKNAFSEHHFNMLKSFASYLSIAIDNASLYKEMESKVEERTQEVEQSHRNSETLNKIGQELISTLDFNDVFKRLYEYVNELMDATIFGVRLYHKERQEIEYKYGYERGELLSSLSVPMSNKDNYSVWCIENQKEVFINDNETEFSRYVSSVDVVEGDFPHSLIMYPMVRGDEILGLISVQSFEKNAYSDYHLSIVKTLAHYTTIALDNARSFEIMELMVQERTAEIQEQSKQIEKSYENTKLLSEIGRSVSTELDTKDIISKVYESVNNLMDAAVFGIALYREKENDLFFSGAMEKGVPLDDFSFSLKDDTIASKCFHENKEVFINDWEKEFQEHIAVDYDPSAGDFPESMIYIPLRFKEKMLGVFTVQSFEKNSYTSYHLNILQNLSIYISNALENANLYASMEEMVVERTLELQQSYRNTELLNQIGKQLISTLNFDDVFEQLYANVNQLMDATVFGIRLLNKEQQLVEYHYEYERGKRLDAMDTTMDNESNLSVWCIRNKEMIFSDDIIVDAKKYTKMEPQVITGEMTRSVIFLPMHSASNDDEVFGVLSVQSFERGIYTDYHLNIVKALAQYVAIAFDNASRYEVMEKQVQERTAEIQKSQEDTKLLSEMGKMITSQITPETILSRAYESINKLMDAEAFGIGVHNVEKNTLQFPGFIEGGEVLPSSEWNLEEENERLGSICFLNDQMIHTNNLDEDYHLYMKEYVKPKLGLSYPSIIYLPIKVQDKVIGVVSTQSSKVGAYSTYHIDILSAIAIYIGIALDNATLYANLEERVKERTAEIEKAYQDTSRLAQISKDIAESLNVETIISRVYKNVNELMDATCFGIGIFDSKKNLLVMPGFIENGRQMEEFSFDLQDDKRLASWCFNRGEEVFINDYFQEYETYISGVQKPVAGKDSSSVIYIPLQSKDSRIGVLTVQSYEKNVYTEYHLNILRNLANSVATAIENAQLYENLEEEVRERTQEVVEQKEQVEKTFENTKLLSEIGRLVTSQILVEDIIEVVYDNINKLMDAEGFGVGVYNEDKNIIEFPGYIESGNRLPNIEYDLETDKTRLSCVCFNENREMKIDNLETEYHLYMDKFLPPLSGKTCVSIIYLPINVQGRLIGVITVQSFEKNAYSDYHFDIVKNLAVYVGIALDNAGLYANMEDRVKKRTAEIEKAHQDTKLVAQISKDIAESLNIETIIARVYENINTLMDASCFGIGIYDSEEEVIRMPGFIERGEIIDDLVFDVHDDKMAAWCFHNRKEVFISDFDNEYMKYIKLESDTSTSAGDPTHSVLYLPLILKEKVVGVLTVQSFDRNAYNEYHLDILKGLGTTIAGAIENALLYESLEDKVNERTLELLQQKEIIEEKNKSITDSIIYAKRIQDATLPDIALVRSYLEKSFVLFRPKDIVSGDFYWFEKVGNTVLFAVVDCTGHGVPGAFLSLIGHNALNQIVNELKIIEPSQILDALNKKVHKTLQNSLETNSIKDGMDMAICSLNTDTNLLKFSGAYNPLYVIQDGQISEIKGNKMAIGSHLGDSIQFEQEEVQLQEGDTIYLFSDGYADQFGGPKGKKFKYSKFRELLLSIHHKDMDEQHTILMDTIDEWQGHLEQIDDLCVVGYKL